MAKYKIQLTKENLFTGSTFNSSLSTINYKDSDEEDVETEDAYTETDYEGFEISMSYLDFKEMVRIYDTMYNIPDNDDVLRKSIQQMYELGQPYAQIRSEQYYKEEIIEEMPDIQSNYKDISESVLVWKTDKTIYDTEYMLVIFPKTYKTMDIHLVPKPLYDAVMEEDSNKDVWHIALAVIPNITDSHKTDNKSKLKEDNVGKIESANIPVAEITLDSPGLRVSNMLSFMTKNLMPEELAYRALSTYVDSMSFFNTDSGSGSGSGSGDGSSFTSDIYVGKATNVGGFFMIREVIAEVHKGDIDEVFAATKDTFIYNVNFFPFYTEVGLLDDLTFYICKDDDKRTSYGTFTQEGVESKLDEDDILDKLDDGLPFFTFDYTSNIEEVAVDTKTIGLDKIK